MSTPSWTEVRVDVPTGWHELVAEVLALGPCTSVSVGVPSIGQSPVLEGHEVVNTYIPSSDDSPAIRERIGAALEGLGDRVEELAGLRAQFTPMPPEDYATSWREVWRPFRLGRRLVVAPPWWDGQLAPGELRLELEPGGAFGSGRHPTTRECMRVLLDRVAGGERVLDAGSGSGVLSVTAALLGAGSTLGFDLDPVAAVYGDAMAQANGVASRCKFRRGGFEVLDDRDTEFDVVLANIYSDVIQTHAAELASRLAPGGWFAFSGCPRDHAEATALAIQDAGLILEERRRRGRWCTFLGGRAPSVSAADRV